MEILLKIWWILYDCVIAIGIYVFLRKTVLNFLAGTTSQKIIVRDIRRRMKDGMSKDEATKVVQFKRRAAKINAAGFAAITLVGVYIFVDIIFRKILM